MNTPELLIFILFLLLGTFSSIAAIGNFEWYFSTHGAMMFVRWFGRTGARIFYGVLGLFLLAAGTLGLKSLF